jgi:ATP-binding cassette subfamily G (WHITE) protein 2 (SNQ2)
MADPLPLQNIREEVTTAAVPAPETPINEANVAFHNLAHDEEYNSPSSSPSIPPPSPIFSRQRPRGASSVSRVDIGHFDPTGVDELRQTMSRMSENTPGGDTKKAKSLQSDTTFGVPVGDGPFDFEKFIGNVVQKYISYNLAGKYD